MPYREAVTSLGVRVLCLIALGCGTTFAQTAASRLEVGGQVSVLRVSGDMATPATSVGVGGRVTINLAPWASVEGEYQFTPRDRLEQSMVLADGSRLGIRYDRRRSTALFGTKIGYRAERVGIFAKVRPGVTSLSGDGVECLGEVCALVLLAVPDYRPEFVVDVGGVLEVYPGPGWLARVDVGTLLIRHRSTAAPPCPAGDCTTRNLAASFGVGLRF